MCMIEVFKTNVYDRQQADWLVDLIHKAFAGYKANFDLDDCDKILRVASVAGAVHSSMVIHLLKHHGFEIEVLADDLPDTSVTSNNRLSKGV